MPADPKPRPRHRASRAGLRDLDDQLLVLFGRTCQVCGGELCGNQPLTKHHLVNKSLGGDDVIANLALLGGDGTAKCHGAVQRRERVACSMLRRNLTDEQIGYIVDRKSGYFLDRYYPEQP